jgi:hypothetical protein
MLLHGWQAELLDGSCLQKGLSDAAGYDVAVGMLSLTEGEGKDGEAAGLSVAHLGVGECRG